MSNAIPIRVLVQAHAALCAADARLKTSTAQADITAWHTVMNARLDLEFEITRLAPVAVEVPATTTESPK